MLYGIIILGGTVAATLTSPHIPLRPFSSAQNGGVVSTLDLYTQETHLTLAFNVSITESYPGNGAPRFECRLREGLTTLIPWHNCTSPMVFDNSTLDPSAAFTSVSAGGLTELSGGTYTLQVLPIDWAENVGDIREFTWIVDVTPPNVVFPSVNQPWVQNATIVPIFVGTEPGKSLRISISISVSMSMSISI